MGSASPSPGLLAVMTPEEWHGYLMQNGTVNVKAMLKRPPTEFDEDKQLEYATVLISWLSYEGALPRQPNQRQRKRANSKMKKQQPSIQVGEGAGEAQQQGRLQLKDDGVFPKLVEQKTREEPLTPAKNENGSLAENLAAQLEALRSNMEEMGHPSKQSGPGMD